MIYEKRGTAHWVSEKSKTVKAEDICFYKSCVTWTPRILLFFKPGIFWYGFIFVPYY